MSAGFFVLFIVAFFYVNPIAKLGKIDNKAEFMVTVTWPYEIDTDIDTWLEEPSGALIWYNDKTPKNSASHLDRDDLGNENDVIVVDNKRIEIKRNQEIVTIRGIVPGNYTLNIHYYNSRYAGSGPDPVVPVTVKVEKLNPSVKTIYDTPEPIRLTTEGEERTILHFTVDEAGDVIETSTDPFISLIKKEKETRVRPAIPEGQGEGGP